MRSLSAERAQYEADLALLAEVAAANIDDASGGLKVRHASSGFQYTVVSVSKRNVVLKTPEGKQFKVDAATFEKSYEI